MTYTGHVSPGGPAAVQNLTDLTITKVSVGPMDNNAYLLRCHSTGEQLLIDAANDPKRLLAVIGQDGLATIVTTHEHGDHWQALAAVVAATGARAVAHPADAASLPVATDPVKEGDEIPIGAAKLEVIHLVGHTPGSIALLYRDPHGHGHLFTGDSLFPGGLGNTRGNADDFRSLINDVERKVFDQLPDDTWVYPGHGDDTTIGQERPSIPEWRARGW